MTVPYRFYNQGGRVPAAELDANFDYLDTTVSSGVVAAGNSQNTATALSATASVYVISTAPLGSGVRLPGTGSSVPSTLINQGLNQVSVYPPPGGSIYPYATNVAVLADVGGATQLQFIGGTAWALLSPPPPLDVQVPLYYDANNILNVDSSQVGTDLFGTAPLQGDLSTGLSFRPVTLGDWDTTVWTYVGKYQTAGTACSFVLRVTGTPAFTGAASGNLEITGFPFTAATNTIVNIYQISGFTTWPASADGVHLLFSGTTGLIVCNRLASTPTNFAIGNVTAATAIGFTVSGVIQLA